MLLCQRSWVFSSFASMSPPDLAGSSTFGHFDGFRHGIWRGVGRPARDAIVRFRLHAVLHLGVFLVLGQNRQPRCAVERGPWRCIGLAGEPEQRQRADGRASVQK